MSKPKIAMVVQRYGLEVNGGSELSCRLIAEKMRQYYDVEVLTTKAIDYMTWSNEYQQDLEIINGITVRRFKVEQERNVKKFNEYSGKIFGNSKRTIYDELEWMKLQGPVSFDLLDFIKNNSNKYIAIIFFTYTYFTTYFGLQLVPEKSILIPTAHDEPHAYLSIYKKIFHLPRGIGYLTPEEKDFVENFYGNGYKDSTIIGFGVEVPSPDKDEIGFREKYGISNGYLVYVGRIDESKGCRELFEYYLEYCSERENAPDLVLMGKEIMTIPRHPKIKSLGFVSEEDKFKGISGAKFLVMPSPYESLSISVLESMAMGTPIVVNEKSAVLKGHCERSNAGLFYSNCQEFSLIFDFFCNLPLVSRNQFSENAKQYIREYYSWSSVLKNIKGLIELV